MNQGKLLELHLTRLFGTMVQARCRRLQDPTPSVGGLLEVSTSAWTAVIEDAGGDSQKSGNAACFDRGTPSFLPHGLFDQRIPQPYSCLKQRSGREITNKGCAHS